MIDLYCKLAYRKTYSRERYGQRHMGYTLDVAVIQPCVYILNEAKTRALDAITKY